MKKLGNILLRKKNVQRLIIFNDQFLCPTYNNSSEYWSNSGQFTTSSPKVRKTKHTEKSLTFFNKKKYFLYSGVTAHQAVKQKNSYTPDDYWLYLE